MAVRRTSRVATVALCAVALLGSRANALELPNTQITPGATGSSDSAQPDATDRVCERGYARSIRHGYDAQWRRYRTSIFRAYGIPHGQWTRYTIDHLVPLELGGRPFGIAHGTWDLRNVWPEPKGEAIQKDAVENALHESVCYRRGYHGLRLSLSDAQRALERDWTRTPVGLPPIDDRTSSR